jgi:hypothetical protein
MACERKQGLDMNVRLEIARNIQQVAQPLQPDLQVQSDQALFNEVFIWDEVFSAGAGQGC